MMNNAQRQLTKCVTNSAPRTGTTTRPDELIPEIRKLRISYFKNYCPEIFIRGLRVSHPAIGHAHVRSILQ